MRGAVLYGPRDVRFEERAAPTIVEPTDAIIRIRPPACVGPTCSPTAALAGSPSPHRWARVCVRHCRRGRQRGHLNQTGPRRW